MGTVATRRTAAMSRKATTAQAGAAASSVSSPLRVHNPRRSGEQTVANRSERRPTPYRFQEWAAIRAAAQCAATGDKTQTK